MAGSQVNALLDEIDSATTRSAIATYSLDCDERQNLKPKSLAARAHLRSLLCRATGTDPALWSFTSDAHGKPHALFDGVRSAFAISISHSGPYVACAIARAEALGIDIEMHHNWRDLKNIADLAFGPEERRMIEREGASAFYRIWTLRETHAKATGSGLEQAADGIDRFSDPMPGNSAAFSKREIDGSPHWHFSYARPAADLSFAVAVRFDIGISPHLVLKNNTLSE